VKPYGCSTSAVLLRSCGRFISAGSLRCEENPPIFHDFSIPNMVPPFDSVQLVQITRISGTYGRYIELVDGGYKLTYNWGVPHCTKHAWINQDWPTFNHRSAVEHRGTPKMETALSRDHCYSRHAISGLRFLHPKRFMIVNRSQSGTSFHSICWDERTQIIETTNQISFKYILPSNFLHNYLADL